MTMIATRATKNQCNAFLLGSLARASCKFTTSSFSERIPTSSDAASTTAPPSRLAADVSSASDKEISVSASGTDLPCSHLDTV